MYRARVALREPNFVIWGWGWGGGWGCGDFINIFEIRFFVTILYIPLYNIIIKNRIWVSTYAIVYEGRSDGAVGSAADVGVAQCLLTDLQMELKWYIGPHIYIIGEIGGGGKSQCGTPFWNSNQCIGYWALIRVMWMLLDRSQHEEHWSLGRVPLRSWVVDMFHSFNPLFNSLGKMYNFEICISQKICKKCFSTPIFRQNRTLVCSPLLSSSSPLAASYTICSWPQEKNSNWFKIIVHSKNICSSNILYSNIILSVCHGDQSINQSIVIVLLADQRNWRIWTERLIRRRWPRMRLCMYHNIDYPASR